MKKKILFSPLIVVILIIVLGVGVAGAAVYFGGSGETGGVNLQKGLVGWWKLDGNAKDSTPYGHNGNPSTLVGWQYRKQITITGAAAGAQTNYPMKMTVYKSTGTDDSTHVYLGTNVKDDFSDLRFTKFDGITLLDYWIESYTSGVSAVVWIEFDSIPASPGTATFYMYYGNASASSVSSGSTTFNFFDDFGSWQSSLWGSQPAWATLSSGVLTITATNADNALRSSSTFDQGYTLRANAQFQTNSRSTNIEFYRPHPFLLDRVGFFQWTLLGANWQKIARKDPNQTLSSYNLAWDTNWRIFEIRRQQAGNPDIARYQIDSVAEETINDYVPTADLSANLRVYSDGPGYTTDLKVDWILVRKYVFPEPTWTSWGDEQLTFAADRKGQVNKAYSFNGIGDHILVGNVGNSIKAISFWMQANAVASQKIINIDGTIQIELIGSSITATSFPATATVYVDGSASANLPDTNWHFVTITDTAGVSASTFDIGAVSTSYFSGKLDDVKIYNRVLSTTEIATLYSEYNPGIAISNLQKGLVGQWKLDGNAKDSTPYGNKGTVTSATLTTDRKGQANKAYSFNGSTSYIDVGTYFPNITSLLTVSAWVKPGGSQVSYADMWGNHGGTYKGFTMEQQATTLNQFYWAYGNGSAWVITGNVNLTTNQWQHVVAIKDSTYCYFYVNGVEQVSARVSCTSNISPLTTSNFKIGFDSTGRYFNGSIDDVRIYNRALSAAEVLTLYQSY